MNVHYTTQSAYEKIKRYFSKPDARIATDYMGQCQYRVEEGRVLKCAVGCLIPDGMYTQAMEDNSWSGAHEALEDAFGPDKVDSVFGDVDDGFLHEAQKAHDTKAGKAGGVGMFLLELDGIAKEYGLKVAQR